jgi:hypothetical protein
MSIVRSEVRVVAVAVALLAGMATPAATFASDGTSARHAGQEQHCVAMPDQPTRCFATFADGVSYATGGRVTTDDPSTAMSEVSTADLLDLLEIRAILFANSGYGGSTFTIYDYETCTHKGATMISGWNDVVSSVQVGTLCGVRLYEHETYQGAQLPIYVNTSYVGDAMNDRTSSWALF